MLPINQIFKDLWSERLRVSLSIFAIAWGIFAVISTLAIGESLRFCFKQALEGSGKSILVVQGGYTSMAYHGRTLTEPVNLTEQDLVALQQNIKTIASISPEYIDNVKMQYMKNARRGSLLAVAPAYGAMRNISVQPGGRFISSFDEKNATRSVVLGDNVAKQLFAENVNPIGKIILLNTLPFTVVGVTKHKLQLFAYNSPNDSNQVWIPARLYKAIFKPNYINDIVIKPTQPQQIFSIQEQIKFIVAANHQVNPKDENILQFFDSYTLQKKVDSIIFGMQSLLGIIGILTLLIASVGIANIMLISVKKDTLEIGIRMAVGARSHHIVVYYFAETLVITGIGGIMGLLLSFGLVKFISLIPLEKEIAMYTGELKLLFSWGIITITLLILGLATFVAGFIPARRAAQINPADALRYE